jgi:CHAT domain-containing protein
MQYLRKPARRRGAICLSTALLVGGLALCVLASRAAAQGVDCQDGRVLSESEWTQRGATVERGEVPPAPRGDPQLIRVDEHGVDVEIEILDRSGVSVARSDSPFERGATQYAYLPAGAVGATLVTRAKEPAGLAGTVRVAFLALDSPATPQESADCARALRQWADADMAYARGRAVTLGRLAADAGGARAAFESAQRAYALARELLRGPGHASERGLLELNLAALAYYALKDWRGSAAWSAKAAATFAATRDSYRQARAQAIQAAAWIELATSAATAGQTAETPRAARAQFADARLLLTALARLHARRREWYDWALQINNIGLSYTYESRFNDAIPYFARAQQRFEGLSDSTRSALALQNIGYCDWGLGRLSAAIAKFDRALNHMSSTERPNLYLNTLNNNGLAHYEAGRFDEALSLETRALDLGTHLQSDQARARSEYGIGVIYYALGDRELAADFLRRGLQIGTAELDARLRVEDLRALAGIEYETGRLQEAIGHDSEALRLASASWARARILLHLAQEYAAQNDVADSWRILDDLVTHPPYRDELVRASARVQRARLLHAAGSNQEAQKNLLRAIATFDRFDSLADRFDARVELARVYAEQGLSSQALSTLRRAFGLAGEIRAQTANPEYRSSIIQSLRPALSLEVDLLRARFNTLTAQGRLEAARAVAREGLAAVDGERARGFEAWRAEYLEQHSDAELARLLSANAALYRDMAERRFELNVREDRAGTADERAQALRDDIARLRARLDVITSKIARRSRGSGASVADATHAVDRLERTLPPGQAVIEYWLGTTHAYAWILKSRTIDWIELPASGEIESAARTLHALMRSPATSAARGEACAELYRRAFAPLRFALSEVRELTVVPDGSLHYAPFSALRDAAGGDRPYLVQTFTLSVAPALRFLARTAPPLTSGPALDAGSEILLVADPIYAADDPRLGEGRQPGAPATAQNYDRAVLRGTNGGLDLARLESSAREASQIRALFGAHSVDLLQGEDATRDAVLAKDLGRYRFIHIASHGVIDSDIPQLSALILGTRGKRGPIQDPYLRAADLLTETFHAQAIVLSACDTALGKESGGEGIVGLRYAALARGARAVVASLWPVSDGIAATLMTNMYRGVTATDGTASGQARSEGFRVAAALAGAMREELEQAPALDPALWAPFTVYVAGD